MSFLFVFQHDSNHINISIFHQVLAVHKPFFSVQGTLSFVLVLLMKWILDIGELSSKRYDTDCRIFLLRFCEMCHGLYSKVYLC